MKSSHVLILVAIAFGGHAIEEYISAFYTMDPTMLWLARVLSTESLFAWLLVQVFLFIFLGFLYTFRSWKVLWLLLLLVMLSELYHPLVAIFGRTYSGVLSSFLFLPLLWLVYQSSPLILSKGPKPQ